MFVSCDLQDVHQHQGQRHEGSQQGQREQEKAGIEPGFVRFSVGIEDKKDIIRDIEEAFKACL